MILHEKHFDRMYIYTGGIAVDLGENIMQRTHTRYLKASSIELYPICGKCGGSSCLSPSSGLYHGIIQVLHVPLPPGVGQHWLPHYVPLLH